MNSSQPALEQRRFHLAALVAIAVFLAVGLALRIQAIGREGFWIDEIFGASFANLSLYETVVACLRFDVHPPYYYLQLNMWSALGHGDTWLMLNAVAWGMATLVLATTLTLRRFGTLAAVIALAFCAVLGGPVYFSNELRPYTMLAALMLLSWPAADRLLRDYRFVVALPLILLLIVIGGVHSFGTIAVASVLVYVLPFNAALANRRSFLTWLAVAATVGIGIAPWIVNGMMRHANHVGPTSLDSVLYTVSGWVLGYGAIELPSWLQWMIALLEALALIFACVLVPGVRRMISCYVVFPIVFTALICVVWKPIWLFRPFSICAPFLAIAVGALLGRMIAGVRGRAVPAALQALLATVAAASVVAIGCLSYRESLVPWKTQFREAGAYLRENAQATDIVYIPDQIMFWGVARYLVGPQWGSMLKVQDPLNQDRSAYWPGIYQRLGHERLQLLHLEPQVRRVDGFRAPVFIGWTPLPEAKRTKVVWVVGSVKNPYTFHLEDVELCNYSSVDEKEFWGLSVFRLTCAVPAAAAGSAASNAAGAMAGDAS